MNRGFLITRKVLSTDTIASLTIGSTIVLWNGCITWEILSAVQGKADSNRTYEYQSQLKLGTVLEILAIAAKGPVLLYTFFTFWIVAWIDAFWADFRAGRPHLWSLRHVNGPFDWAFGVHSTFSFLLRVNVSINVLLPSLAALLVGDVSCGVLNILGLMVMLSNGVANNPYVHAVHRYADDRLRIVLPTSHHEGTIYVLPSKRSGMDAVWSPKVTSEYREADGEMMTLFSHMRSGQSSLAEPLERLRTTLSRYYQRVGVSMSQLELLASFIYNDRERSSALNCIRKIKCSRAPNITLIGRDLMYALCHIEYLVFMGQGRLPHDLQKKLSSLRLMSRSGASRADEPESVQPIGWSNGLTGYAEAVRYIYTIFDEQLDQQAITFSAEPDPLRPLPYSAALSTTPVSDAAYVAELWETSCRHSESLFTALYMFTLIWSMERGNTHGTHIFPLRCRDQDGDLVSQQIVWRQAWFVAVIAQLVSASRLMFAFFVAGWLQ